MQTAVWVKRLFHFNLIQVGLNSVLLFLLATWYIGLPSEEDANKELYQKSSSQSDAVASFSSNDPLTAGTLNAEPAQGSMQGAPGQGGPTELAGPPPGSDDQLAPPEGQGAPIPPNAVAKYIEEATLKMKALGEEQGSDVSAFVPTVTEVASAAGTGDFFNAKTLLVLRKLKGGYAALEGQMPDIPDGTTGPKPFEP